LAAVGGQLFVLGLLAVHACVSARSARPALERKRQVVRHLQLTDLAVFTEARYTRHPTQADLGSAFQDHPLSLEHFPTGSLVSPVVASGGPCTLHAVQDDSPVPGRREDPR
jgi:hypothetical protein